MTALSIQPPFPLITDIDGQPLEDGYIWIGVANLPPIGNPIAVYWDAALTQPAALPVRTRGGYPVNNGTPARLYVNSDYSIQVQNKNGSVLYSAPQATERYGGLIISSADISFLQAGANAVIRSAQSKMRDVVSVKDFGAVGDGVADDTVAIQAAFNSGAKFVEFGQGSVYKTTDTIICPISVGADFQSSQILYTGTRDRPAFQFGTTAGAQEASLLNVNLLAQTTDVSNDAFVGLKVFNAQRNRITVTRISGFTHNVEFVSRGQGVTGVSFSAAFLGTCKYALTTTCDGAAFNYINANTFFVEDWTNVSPQAGDSHGWFARGIAGAFTVEVQNGNRVHFHSIQPGNGSIGEVRNAAKLVDVAALNIMQVDRYESGRGNIAVISGPVGDGITAASVIAQNVFQIGLLTQGGGAIVQSLSETGTARLNLIQWTNDLRYAGDEVNITNLASLVKAYSSSTLMMTGPLHVTTGTGTPAQFIAPGGIEMGADVIRMNTADRTIGFFIDIDGGETFQAWVNTSNGLYPAIGIAAYDASGNRMSYPGGGAVPVIKSDATARYNRWSTDTGGAYLSGAANSEMTFTTDSTVKRLRVFIYGGLGWVRAFGIRRLTQKQTPLSPFSGLISNPVNHYVAGDPTNGTFGIYNRGDLGLLDTASGSGLDAYQATLGGYLCAAWMVTTAVTVGMLRHNGGNVYECTTAGTTAGAGGPSGTGSSISDGTAVWKYLSTKAVFTLV
jgi:hypothetical protein